MFTFRHKLVLILLILQFNVVAQSIQKKFTQKDGLSSYNLKTIVKDKNSFLWICTQDGLSKFDGVSFINYTNNTINENHQIDFSDCRNLFLDSANNQLWVMGTDAGLNVINCTTGNVVGRYLNNFKAEDNWLITNKRVKDEVWIGTRNGLWSFNMQTHIYKKIPLNTNNFTQSIYTITTDEFGHILVFVNREGLYVVDAQTKKVVSKEDISFFQKKYDQVDFTTSAVVSNKLLLGTNKGIKYYTIDKIGKLSEFHFNSDNIFEKEFIRNISVIGEKIYILSNKFVELTSDFDSYKILSENVDDSWLSEINTVCELTPYLLALGCNAGIAIFDKSERAIIPTTNDEKHYNNRLKHLFGIYPLKNGSVLSATQNGLFESGGKTFLKTIKPSKYFQNISAIYKEEQIVSNAEGLKIYKNDRLVGVENIYPEFKNFKSFEVNSCLKYNDSLFILGTEYAKGILLWNKTKKSVVNITTNSTPIKLKSNTVNSIFLDSRKKLWILSDFSISLIDLELNTALDMIIPDSKVKNLSGLYFDMTEIDGNFWIASYGAGILILDSKYNLIKTLTQNEGLCNNGVYKIFNAGNTVFVSSNNGISKIDATTLKIKNLFYPDDGLHGNSFEEACGAQVNGKIYFGGLDGFTVIDPTKFKNNIVPPKLYFEEINIQTANSKIDTTNLFIKKLDVPNNYTQAKISFIGLNYQNPNRVNYWYRIKEVGDEWIDYKNQNFVTLIGIAPGKYHLEVKAANEDGVECAPISMELHFLPKWYQTILFKILVALLIAATLFILYSFRIRQLKKVLAVRQKISQNLHDDIGSTLSAINMYTQVAKLQPQENDFINSIEENTQDALGKLDDIIWSTNPKNDKIKNLVERMDGFARPLLQAKNIQFNFTHNNIINEQKIGEATRQNLFVIFKEAINNVAKYSECQTCTVVMDEKNKNICCTITDDGKGFDVNRPTERNGILNMQLRAKEMKGSFNIVSVSLKGTTIKVQLPV